jgi:hypothetical protein
LGNVVKGLLVLYRSVIDAVNQRKPGGDYARPWHA